VAATAPPPSARKLRRVIRMEMSPNRERTARAVRAPGRLAPANSNNPMFPFNV
jgi:hypothetical protein